MKPLTNTNVNKGESLALLSGNLNLKLLQHVACFFPIFRGRVSGGQGLSEHWAGISKTFQTQVESLNDGHPTKEQGIPN